MFGIEFFHDTFRKAHLIFGNLFNDIRVYRYDSSGKRVQTIAVPLEFGPKQKTISRVLSNPEFEKPTSIILPCMSFQFTTVTRNPSLQLNKTHSNAKLVSRDGGKTVNTQHVAVPYQIGVQLSIYAKNTYDAYQIIEQIIPYFIPEWSVSANFVPDMDYMEDVKIVLSDLNLTDNFEVAEFEGRRMIVHTFSFLMNVPFYGPVNRSGLIKRVNLNYYTPPGDGAVTDFDVANTPSILTYELTPGLTANGEPTSNVAESISYKLIQPEDPYGFCEVWTDWTTGQTVNNGTKYTNQTAADMIATQRASTMLVYGDATAAQVKVQEKTTSSSSIDIDVRKGEYVILNLQTLVTSVQFNNWRSGVLNKLTLEIRNNGSGDIDNWGSVIWTGGDDPQVTQRAGAKDIFMFHTADGGATIYGTVVGLDYS